MSRDERHPLQRWLEKRGISPGAFARLSGLPFHAIYQHIKGKWAEPKVRILVNIEDATKGEVTTQEQANWWKRRNKW